MHADPYPGIFNPSSSYRLVTVKKICVGLAASPYHFSPLKGMLMLLLSNMTSTYNRFEAHLTLKVPNRSVKRRLRVDSITLR